jgi:7-carboxy-7-deazaguanine synthase
MSSQLRLSELFTSIQGEGSLVGMPSVFIRLSGCNLRCIWCDTPYASWDPEGPNLSVEAITEQALATGVRHAVITGGEPMLFAGTEILCQNLAAHGLHLTIETAGTIFRELPCDLMSISPKLSHSDPVGNDWLERHRRTRSDLAPLRDLVRHYEFQLKFVVRGTEIERDLDEIDTILAQLGDVPSSRVVLMPEGVERDTLTESLKALVPVAMGRGYRLSPRMHVDLFGNTKGT